MNGLNIFTSNCMEILAEQLALILRAPLSSLFSPEIIVVQSRGMERWVAMELARHNGICANCFFPFPNTFLQEIFKKTIPDLPEEPTFEPLTMTFKIMKVLPECIHLTGFESLKRYLDDENNGMKLFEISKRIADLFDQYLVFRPDMIFNWEKGKDHHWQAYLWRKLSSGKEHLHRAGLWKAFIEKIRKSPRQIEHLPGRVSLFGMSYLPLFHLEAFVEISRYSQVNLFLMNPCKEYWGDIVSGRETGKIRKKYTRSNDISEDLYLEEGHRLLASMGTVGRNFISLIGDLDSQVFELFKDNKGHTTLEKIQSDILSLKSRRPSSPSPAFDSSVQIHSCHSPMREIEVLHDNLLAMFQEAPDLLPKDIVVMTPDIHLYALFVQAVFGAQTDEKKRIPFTIADQNIIKESRIIEGFMSILDLKNSRMSVNHVMALLELSEIKEKFDISESEIEILERWIKETNIRWGIDAEHRRKLGLPGFSENTWKAGIKRLLLGYAMPGFGCKMFSGILPYDHIEGGEVKTLGKFIGFLDRLIKHVDSLNQARTLSGWSKVFSDIIEQFFIQEQDSEPEIRILRSILDDMSKKEAFSGFDTSIKIEVAKSYLGGLLEEEHLTRGFISGGVTFCAMLPMRSIPFKVVCLVGMDTDAFPRETKTLEFNLMAKQPRIGDRNRRNDDKYLFLEALLSARNKFYISYVGQSIQDNARIPPSVLVSEFIDCIKEGFGFSEEQVVVFHRLQAFSPEYFKNDGKLFSYSYENFMASSKMFDRKEAPPLVSTKLPEPDKEWKDLSIRALCAFFNNPAKYLLEKRLGIYLHESADLLDERENFRLDHLGKYMLDQQLVTTRRSGSSLKDFYPLIKASGELPHGKVGECIYNEMSLDTEDFVRKINDHTKGRRPEDLDVDLDISGFRIFDRVTDVYEKGIIKAVYVNTKPKYLLNTWIYHLIVCALLEDERSVQSFLLCKDAAWEFTPVSSALDILKSLLNIYWKGTSEPVHFFPVSSFEYVCKILLKNQTRQGALKASQRKWRGSDFSRGESKDPYFERCFGKNDSLDKDFEKISIKIYSPLLNHCNEIR
ncbi:MAG: exodeoxyribonuclease V subunit gamma [Deltaproteobacteria bacterium]|nr:exodeoxyribonuclease V subunit gamma [Deltaproteobacteria bacterium]